MVIGPLVAHTVPPSPSTAQRRQQQARVGPFTNGDRTAPALPARRAGFEIKPAHDDPRRKPRLTVAMAAVALCLVSCAANPSPPAMDWDSAPTDDASLHRMVEDRLPGGLKLEDHERPEVKLVRWVKHDAWAAAQVACMTGQGFPSTAQQGGIQYPDVPNSQGQALKVAAYVCALSYPVDPRTQLPWTRSQAMAQYRHLVDTAAPCVEALGHLSPAMSMGPG